MNFPNTKPRPEPWNNRPRQPGSANPAAEAAPQSASIQAWRAWACCGDGGQMHLIIDPQAQQVWLLPSDDDTDLPRSVQ